MIDDFIEGDEFDPEVAARAEFHKYEAKADADALVMEHVRRSKVSYARVFGGGNATADDVAFVMHDLAWFCKAFDPLWSSDPREQDRYVARREVFQRILEYTSLDADTLYKRYVETQPTRG